MISLFKRKKPLKNQELLDKAIELGESGKVEEAIACYEEIIRTCPDWASPCFNLGLIYKYQSNWVQSLQYNQMAVKLGAENDGAWWNIGIAATALKKWRIARQAWNKFGLNLDVNDEEPAMNLRSTPIRLNPNDNAEVVWCKRIDPARAIILNVPLPQSGHLYHDLVLNDGVPIGSRISNGVEYDVFNELELIRKSDYKTYSVEVSVDNQDDIAKLEKLCYDQSVGFEDWSTIRNLCRQCSEGTPHEHHDEDLESEKNPERKMGIAAKDLSTIVRILDNWRVITLCEYGEIQFELE